MSLTHSHLEVLCGMLRDAVPGASWRAGHRRRGAAGLLEPGAVLELAARLLNEDPEVLRAYVVMHS